MIAQLDKDYILTRPSKALIRIISYLLEGRPLSTHGRFINSFIKAIFYVEKHLPLLKQVKRPIFIIGIGRSGTTILGKVLSIHKDICWLNEPKLMWHSAYPYEDVMGNYTQVKSFYRLDESYATETVAKNITKLYSYY